MKRKTTTACSILLVLCVHLAIANRTSAEVLTIGTVSDEFASEVRAFQPLAEYLQTQLRKEGIDKVKIRIARSIPEMAEFLKKGQIDVYIDSPFPAQVVNRMTGSRSILTR